jgi:hypothetical protein
MHTFKLFGRLDGSFGYQVYDGQRLAIQQSYAPGVAGKVPMSEAEAEDYAKAAAAEADAALQAALAALAEPPAEVQP